MAAGIVIAHRDRMSPQNTHTVSVSIDRPHRVPRCHVNIATCQVDARYGHAYELCVVPHADPALAVLERFDEVMPALLRQAQIARLLRENGWIVIDQVATLGAHAA